MCQTVEYGDMEIETVGDLAAFIGGENICWRDGKSRPVYDTCLCPIDLEKSLAQAGKVFQWHESGKYIVPRGDDPSDDPSDETK